jgi:RecJ-like exonuclease
MYPTMNMLRAEERRKAEKVRQIRKFKEDKESMCPQCDGECTMEVWDGTPWDTKTVSCDVCDGSGTVYQCQECEEVTDEDSLILVENSDTGAIYYACMECEDCNDDLTEIEEAKE